MRTRPHHSKSNQPVRKAASVAAASPARLLRVLLAFSPAEPTPTAASLAQSADVPLSTVYRYLLLLREHGLVAESTPHQSGRYRLTPRLYGLAEAARIANPIEVQIAATLATLRDRSGECALFIQRIGDSAVCTRIAEAAHPIRLSFTVGHPMPLDSGAGAKLLLATMPTLDRVSYLTARVSTKRRKALDAELDTIAQQGWATSEGEVDDGVWAVAARCGDAGLGGGVLSVAGPSFRLNEKERAAIVREVRDAAKLL